MKLTHKILSSGCVTADGNPLTATAAAVVAAAGVLTGLFIKTRKK